MPTTLLWTGTLTAVSSISHGGDTLGTATMLRRERIVQPDGSTVDVPVISGNAFRGRLRRIGEELLRDALGYAGEIPLSAFHALRSGGALAKTSAQPLSGARLATLRRLIPQVAVFGCAGGGRIIDGCLQVGKVVPILAETHHLLDPALAGTVASQATAINATQIETSVRLDDAEQHDVAHVVVQTVPLDPEGHPGLEQLSTATEPVASMLMQYRTETFPAGTIFATWLRLDRANKIEVSFFDEVLAHFEAHGHLGGRAAAGHGQVRTELNRAIVAGQDPPSDWRAHVIANRDEAIAALKALT